MILKKNDGVSWSKIVGNKSGEASKNCFFISRYSPNIISRISGGRLTIIIGWM